MNRHQLYICTHAVGKGDRAGFAYAIEEIVMIETLARDSQSEHRIHVKAEFIDAPHESRAQFLESEFVKLLNLGPFYSKFKEALKV
jgi:hypothetical protein